MIISPLTESRIH